MSCEAQRLQLLHAVLIRQMQPCRLVLLELPALITCMDNGASLLCLFLF
jgi:hypothetical protein